MTKKYVSKKYKIDSRKWPGVFGYDSIKRTIQGKPDVCYYISYRTLGRLIWEKIGWKSEGYAPQIASETRSDRVRKARHGEMVKTAKEIAREKQFNDRTLDEIKNAYFESDRGKKLKGRKTDINRYEKHLKPILGKRLISTLSRMDINRIKSSMKGNAPATVYNALELLRRLINYGAKHNLCAQLPFTIKLPKRHNEVTEYLEPEEMERLMNVLESWPSKDVPRMLKIALLSGIRRGEIFKLKDRDLDFTQKLIKLRDPKGGAPVSIPMSEPVKALLEDQIRWRDKTYPDSSFIFPGMRGAQRVTSIAVNRIKEKANLPKGFRIFHGLRHHFAVTLANSGEFSLDMIGELLTHKDVAMTKRYAQFLPGTMKKASNRAADLIQQQVQKKSQDKVIDMNEKQG
jgi:integrase